jgi:aminopeptidase-like protein
MLLAPAGEPQLGKRGLYRATGGTNIPDLNLAMLWVLTPSDGWHDLLAVAERAALPFATIRFAADRLCEAGLLAE